MKKNTTKIFIAAIFLTISGTAYAQEGRVGINTSTPAATLDVVASATDLTRTDGFIAPRITGDQLKAKDSNYTTAQDGAIVYVTAVVASTSDKTTNVTSIGYYYFDKTQGTAGRWMKIANPSAAGIYQEPWNNVADGTPATTNTQNLYQTGDIGIRTNSPKATLDVQANDTGRPFGIIAPRVTAVQLRNAGGNFNADQDAALVYVTQEFGSSDTPTDRTSNVTSIGYYYFDKTQGTAGRWMKIANPTTIPIVIGVLSNTVPSIPVNIGNYNTGAYIDLPAGKWMVNATLLLRLTGPNLANDAALWIRAGFSTSSSSYISADVSGVNILCGSLVGPSKFGVMNGIVVINNASGSTQRYYLWKLPSQAYGSATGAEVLSYFGGAWGENQIVATPVN